MGAFGGASKSDHVWWTQSEYFNLIVGQGVLKSDQFVMSTWAFRDAGLLMEGFGQAFSSAFTSAKRVVSNFDRQAALFVHVGFHGDESARATQVVGVRDADARLFEYPSQFGSDGISFFSIALSFFRGLNGGDIHGESVAFGKRLNRIELLREFLKVRVEAGAGGSKFVDGECGRLKTVVGTDGESIRLKGEMNFVFRSQGLSFYSAQQGSSDGVG